MAEVGLGEPHEGNTWGRLPDGIGDFVDTLPTPGAPNLPAPVPEVRLNEVDCHGREFIEVINVGEIPADLRGWFVTDDVEQPDHAFPLDGIVLDPGAIDAVRRQTADSDGFTFGIACGADTITLLDPTGRVVDAIEVAALPAAFSYGRLPDGIGGR